jgi:hypothetical protein
MNLAGLREALDGELIEQAAAELTAVRPDATADDVLTYASALKAHQAAD